jgi:hypothetical protein
MEVNKMIKINGYDNLEKYLTTNCKDRNYIKENLKDVVDDNMLEAEHSITGIDIEISTSKEKILLNYNISYGKTQMDLIEHFQILKFKEI